MKLVSFNQLSANLLNQISDLCLLCPEYEPYINPSSIHGEHCFILCFHDNLLIGYLSFLEVLQTREAEITAIVHPEYRNSGIFTAMLTSAKTELLKDSINNIYSAVPEKFQNCSFCKNASHTEYLLTLDYCQPNTTFHCGVPGISFIKSSQETYNILLSHKIIGICNLSFEHAFTNIWGVEIKKPYRSNGYGFLLIQYVMNDYFSHYSQPLILQVTSLNPTALHLYKKCGFTVLDKVAYFHI